MAGANWGDSPGQPVSSRSRQTNFGVALNQRGFTLLEVIVALAITGFLLGSLFTLVAGSKQLAWRAEDNLLRTIEIRASTNFALLQDEFTEVPPILRDPDWQIEPGEELPIPERKTDPSIYTMAAYQLTNRARDSRIEGVRWRRLELPQ